MDKFLPLQYMQIAIANHYGLDKKRWKERLHWFDHHKSHIFNDIDLLAKFASEPMMFRKMCFAYEQAMAGMPVHALVSLDATASGVQLLGALMACRKTCLRTNLINDGTRHDLYGEAASYMNAFDPTFTLTRQDLKDPVMTVFYGSTEQPKQLFGEGSKELEKFYQFLEEELTGAYEAMADIAGCWNPEALSHNWVLPDNHHVNVLVTVKESKRVEVDELGSTFTYEYLTNGPSEYGRSIAANVVHSIDGYIVRKMIRRAAAAGFVVLTIHK